MEDVRGRVHMEDDAPSSPPHESATASSAQGQSASSAPGKMSLSFNMGKALPKKKTEVKMQEEEEAKEERISVSSLKEAAQLSKPKKVDVRKIKAIPLIKKNHWIPNGIDIRDENGSNGAKPEEEVVPEGPLSLEEEAARALLKDAAEVDVEEEREVKSIPLLIQNTVPGMEELVTEDDKFRHDVRLRPESATLAEYMNTPVEDYGYGMLMGMGWKPGDPIGLTNKQVVEPMEFLSRGRRLGLGADEGALPHEQQKKKFIKPGESREGPQNMRVLPGEDGKIRHFKNITDRLIPVHSMRMRKDALVEFTDGIHMRMYGRVTDFDGAPETATKISVRLNLTGEVVAAFRYDLQILDAHALPKDHPALVIGALKKKDKKRKSGSRSRSRSKSSGSDRSRSRSRGKKKAKKEKKKKDKKKDKKPAKEDKNERITWVRPNIRVRVVSQKFEGGEYYNQKGRVEDVVDSVYFTLVMPNGKRVDDVKQKYVESALPKAGGKAMVLRGEHKGSVGLLLERNAKMQKAVVQFEEDMSLATLSFDDLAEYAPS